MCVRVHVEAGGVRVRDARDPTCFARTHGDGKNNNTQKNRDQASVLKQLGLLPDALAPHVPGAEQADKAADAAALPSNGLIPVD